VALALFLVLFVFVWQAEIIAIANWLWGQCLAAWDYLWPTPGPRGR
jgi:hypothetical protein